MHRESSVDTPGYYHAHETARQDEVDGTRLAGFVRRAIGFGIDFILVSMLRKPALFLWQSYIPHEWERHTLLDLFQIVSAVVLVIYFSLSLYIGNGQTIGKRIMGTRVISLTHSRITLWQAVERALGYGASFLEAGFGFLQYFLNRNRQCVHDRIAQTIVADIRASGGIGRGSEPLALRPETIGSVEGESAPDQQARMPLHAVEGLLVQP
jgi:uncharacterized RDD family membrane protein YckC